LIINRYFQYAKRIICQTVKIDLTFNKGDQMQKLSLIQIMNLAEELGRNEWIGVLIKLNNTNQLEHFFELIQNKQMLQSALQGKKKENIR
jgi:hypothetical protein